MISLRLTDLGPAVPVEFAAGRSAAGQGSLGSLALAAVFLTGLGGCVSVKAPDKPIVIELNINIRQEVVYRLAEDAGNTIQSNPDIF